MKTPAPFAATSLALLLAAGSVLPVRAQTGAPESAPAVAAQSTSWRALSRFGYGPNVELLQEVQAAGGGQSWALAQIDAAWAASRQSPSIPPALADFNAALPGTFAAFQQERRARLAGQENYPFSRDLARHAAAWRIAACSQSELENPLLARMTEFWFNHLNVFVGKGPVRPFVGHYVVNVIRANALGRFEDLLLASARHPAMLFYLDQAQSVANGSATPSGQNRGLNENYARELMELHTLGVDGGYSQHDVRELARVLTGWTVDPRGDSGFRFAPRLHDHGAKVVMGHAFTASLPWAGQAQGEEAIRLLARHPATARRIALRLARFFVADQPPEALLQRLERTFLDTQGDTRALLRTLVQSAETWDADNRLFKTPMDYACSVLTATGALRASPEPRTFELALGYLAGAGQPLHGWQTPDGYKVDAATWLAPEALTRRADFALAMARRGPEPEFLKAQLAAASLRSIEAEAPALRAGLMLASPDFMYK